MITFWCRRLLMIAALAGAGAAMGQQGSWSLKQPMPIQNSEFSAVAIKGLVYAVGGFKAVNANALLIYDPETDSWDWGADVPIATHHSGVATVHNKVYVIAGTGAENSRVQIYDPETDGWSRGAQMPTKRTALAVAVVDDRIHAIGGSRTIVTGEARKAHEAYDPETDSWEKLAPIPTPTEHVFAETIDDLIYVVGGRNGLVNRADLQIYDPVTDTWRSGASAPIAVSGMAVEVYDKKIYVFGGEDLLGGGAPGSVIQAGQRYDPRSDLWEQIEAPPEALHGIADARVGNKIFLFGGAAIAGSGEGTDFVQQLALPNKKLVRPRKFAAEAETKKKVLLTWQDKSVSETDFLIQMKTAGKRFKKIAVINADTEQAVISELAPGMTYLFRIRARHGNKKSPWSKKAKARTASSE